LWLIETDVFQLTTTSKHFDVSCYFKTHLLILQYLDRILWDNYVEQQKALCRKLNVAWTETEPNQLIGLADNIELIPIHGLRHPIESNSAGWYIWTQEYSDNADFFKSVHSGHLVDIKPELLKYLGLPPGYRFLIDDAGYEDIWYDETLLNV